MTAHHLSNAKNPNRPVNGYRCVKCQTWHSDLVPEYLAHLTRRAWRHLQTRPPTPAEVFVRLMEEAE
jgi:hypothetical protein